MTTSTITVLCTDTSRGHSASKTWRLVEGQPELVPFDAGWLFRAVVVPVGSIRDLGEILAHVAGQPDAFVTRWLPRPGVEGAWYPRRGRDRADKPATYEQAPRGLRWLPLDIDGLELPFVADLARDPERVVAHVVSLLPPCFHDVTTWWTLTSSAGMRGDGRSVSLRLFFWLDRELLDGDAITWTASFGLEVDPSVYHAVQPIYVAAPRFEDGLVDPLPRRFGLLVGRRDLVVVPPIPAPRDVRPGGGIAGAGVPGRPVRAHYEEIIRELGDGPGGRGFHAVLRDATWSYCASGRTDWTWLKEDIRRRAEGAYQKPSRDPDYVARAVDDEALDDLIEGALAKLAPPEVVTREHLEDLARSWKRAKGRYKAAGQALEKIVKGEPFTRTKIVEDLAAALPDADAGSIARVFETSLQVMPGAPTVDQVREEIERLQRVEREASIARDLAQADEQRQRIRDAFGGARDWPYTEVELEAFAREAGCTRDAFRHRWLVQYSKQFYVFFAGAYRGPLVGDAVATNALTFLAPAITAGVVLHTATPKGIAPKSVPELLADYGMPAVTVEADMTLARSVFDAATHTMTEAVCPLRDLTPSYDPDVAEWLRLFAGSKHDALLDWIAALTRLEKPCPALVLTGPTGAGKSLLADGLARLWHKGVATKLASIMGAFNSALLDCPLVFGDEGVPKDTRGIPRTEELRELVASNRQPLRRKYLAESSVRGAIRLILAANNTKLISSSGDLTNDDIAAIAARYVHIKPDPAAVAFLASKGGRDFTESLVAGDRIARHALWLRNHRPVPSTGRWAVPGDCDELLREMRTSTGLRWALCHWIVSWLLDPHRQTEVRLFGMSPRQVPAPVVHADGRVYVHAEGLRAAWSWYLPEERVPDLQRLTRALVELCRVGEEGRRRFGGREARVWYREVVSENLIAWAETQNLDPNEVKISLAVLPVSQVSQRGPERVGHVNH